MRGETETMALSARIAGKVRELLIAGAFRPGERLSEQQMAERFSVSRNSLREAFRVLTSEGLIVHHPNRGVFVVSPDEADVIDLYRVRAIIQKGALAALVPEHPALNRMHHLVGEAEAASARGEWAAVGTLNMEFHRAMVSLADSPRLSARFDLVLAELRLVFGQLGDGAPLHAPFITANAELLAALRAGDIGMAQRLLDTYLSRSERAVLATFSRVKSG